MWKDDAARLRAIFERVLILSAAAGGAMGGAQACSASKGDGGSDAAADQDASAIPEASVDVAEAAADGGADSRWPPGCAPAPPEEYDAGVDAPGCEYRVRLPCGVPAFVTTIWAPYCTMPEVECDQICTGPAQPTVACEVANGFGCDVEAGAFVAADGAPIVVECDKCAGAGRRPPGLVRAVPRRSRAGSLGEFLSQAAHLEAASVVAFEILAHDLRAHGAPRELVVAARRSARDEVRHARAMERLARSHGSEPPAVRVAAPPRRSLEAIAVENAREGCVRETYGALVASWQAVHARDALLRGAMARIAADETRHAALAWMVDRWAGTRLDPRARRKVAATRRRAFERLRREASAAVPEALVRRAGVPSPARARCLVDLLARGLRCTLSRAPEVRHA